MTLETLKRTARKSRLYDTFRNAREEWRLRRWRANGSEGPPPHCYKRLIVSAYGRAFGTRTLVETGTYLGDMVAAMLPHFAAITTIELDKDLHRRAQKRFEKQRSVTLLQGDSGARLPEVVASLNEPALFWLDGHYSGGFTARGELDTPILAELRHIMASPHEHVVLIDDARLFTGTDGYPTLSEVEALVNEMRPDWVIESRSDVIRCHHRQQQGPSL